MLKVTIGNNVNRKQIMVDEDITLRECLEQNEIDYTRGFIHLDGSALQAGDMDKTFAELNIKERCYLLQVVKADNAVA